MSHVAVTGDQVEIRLSILETVLTFHGTLHIPLRHIRSVSTDPVEHVWWTGVRVGIGIPGASHGTFRTPNGLIFSDYRNGERCLSIELADEHYRRVIVEIDPPQDKSQVQADIQRALAQFA
ncbi:MAG: hypothetical protein K6U74_09905 [Firmicutes bacterium]|nr:hypothetical protein [Bacillota bacterium]